MAYRAANYGIENYNKGSKLQQGTRELVLLPPPLFKGAQGPGLSILSLRETSFSSVFHRFGQAKFANDGKLKQIFATAPVALKN